MLEILFVSDYVCPYCLVAKEALRRALQEEEVQTHFTWQPFELTEAPRPRVDTYHDEVRRAHYQVLVEPCRQLGLDMKLPPRVVPRPYTQLAFEGWLYACDHGCGDAYNDLVYRAYFIEEQDIGDATVLTGLARQLGLDDNDLANALAEGRYTAQEKAAVAYARDKLQTHGVPGIYFDGHKVEPAGYTIEDMRRLLQAHLRTAQAPTPDAAAESTPIFSCNENGCGTRPAVSSDFAAVAESAPTFGCNESGCG